MEQNCPQGEPIYNSRILDTYVKFLRSKYPQVNIHPLLAYAGVTADEVADEGHWFNQQQVDRFYEKLVEMTDNTEIAREAGRFAASPEALGSLRQFVLGMISPDRVFSLIDQSTEKLVKSTTYKTRELGHNRFEISVRPGPGVEEKAFQCFNRIGFFEAIGNMFGFGDPMIDHPECMFEGGQICRYIVSWKNDRTSLRKRLKVLVGSLYGAGMLGMMVPKPWVMTPALWHAYGLAGLALYLAFQYRDRACLRQRMEEFRASSEKTLQQINASYSNALIVNEIGQTVSQATDIETILHNVVGIIQKRLDFQRCVIYLVDAGRTRLCMREGYSSVFGQLDLARDMDFRLDNPDSRGIFVTVFKEQRPILINDLDEVAELFSPRSLKLARDLGVRSFICCPIICDGKSIGVLAVDNVDSKRTLVKSDMSLLMGISSTLGVSIRNAELVQTLKEQLQEIQVRDKELQRHREILEEQVDIRTVELNEALVNARDLAEQAREASLEKSRFLANMSHEIRTPLYGVLGMTEILLNSDMSEGQRSKAQSAFDSGKMLLRVIDDILDLSKIEAGKLELEKAPFSLKQVTRGVLDLFKPLADAKALALTLTVADHVPDYLLGDSVRLRQVLSNLVSNAIKFTEQGNVDVSVDSLPGPPEMAALEFVVADSGIGIAADKLEQIFEGFTQAEGDTTRKYGGTGLGTTIARHLVEMQGGTIGVESETGIGSRFWFRLDYPKTVECDLAVSGAEPEFPAGVAERPLRILLVEDTKVNQEITSWHLIDSGFQVELAENGIQAITKTLAAKFDLIFMDVQMPEMDGFDTTLHIRRSNCASAPVPIIGLTANTFPEDHQRCLEAGMNEVLAKPLSRQALLSAVDRWTSRRDGGDRADQGGRRANDEGVDKFDFQKLLSEFKDNVVFLEQVSEIFVRGAHKKISQMCQALDSGDCVALAGHAHAIRGSASNLMGVRLAEAAGGLEEMCRAGNLGSMPAALVKLEAELIDFRSIMQNELARHTRKNRAAS